MIEDESTLAALTGAAFGLGLLVLGVGAALVVRTLGRLFWR